MITRNKKTSKKARIEALNLKRETVKNLTAGEQKRIKGGGGARAGVVNQKGKLDGGGNN
jgi:hypothetical protein